MITPKVSYEWTWGLKDLPWIVFDFGNYKVRINYRPNHSFEIELTYPTFCIAFAGWLENPTATRFFLHRTK